MTKNPLLYGVLLLVLAVFVTQCCFTVHQTQQALVLQLGDPLPEIYRPGLHFKLPFIQKVVYFDARVLDYAASSREAFTVDKKTIVLDNYARWRISDPLQFYRTMRTIPGAQARLDDVFAAAGPGGRLHPDRGGLQGARHHHDPRDGKGLRPHEALRGGGPGRAHQAYRPAYGEPALHF